MDRATRWLVEQFERPAAAYTTAEWARMAGLPTYRVARWFVARGLIERSKGRKTAHHVVTRAAVQADWRDFWRSVRQRLADVAEKAHESN